MYLTTDGCRPRPHGWAGARRRQTERRAQGLLPADVVRVTIADLRGRGWRVVTPAPPETPQRRDEPNRPCGRRTPRLPTCASARPTASCTRSSPLTNRLFAACCPYESLSSRVSQRSSEAAVDGGAAGRGEMRRRFSERGLQIRGR